MGTSYAVEADCPAGIPRSRVEAVLADVSQRMSTFQEDSELSAFNRAPVGMAIPVSPALVEVAAAAQRVAVQTDGAFDVTVGPLVALWGFGADAATKPPTAAELRAVRAVVGFRKFAYGIDPPTLKKLAPVTLDFSAIAKGYAVDRIAALLAGADCRSYLVELGGEVRVRGTSSTGGPWRIGIESPFGSAMAGQLSLRAGAVATSGDYRQYRAQGAGETTGKRTTHIIDPRTGAPVRHRLASVTVVAETAVLADAYATALMVLGEQAGPAFAERHDLAALFIRRTETGYAIEQTPAMAVYRTPPLP